MSKPLMNRLLLENSNKAAEQSLEASAKDLIPEWNQDRSLVAFETPQKSQKV